MSTVPGKGNEGTSADSPDTVVTAPTSSVSSGPVRTPRIFFPAIVTLISAFLLFQVQPLISKAILPWFGGSPAVWTTAMLFFQLVLLAGYAYAHLLIRIRSRGWQLAIHVGLLAVAIGTLPITPSEAWKPTGATAPAGRILLLLGATVGLPYFLLSSTAPLIQAWFARLYPGRSPYRLYSLSNVGSLAALLTYPFLVEPALTTIAQGRLWSLGFIAFAFGCALFAHRASGAPPDAAPNTPTHEAAGAIVSPEASDMNPRGRRLRQSVVPLFWIALPALAVIVLLSVTNQLCRDVAVVPFLWIVPLTLYLLSFIITFDHQRWYARGLLAIATAGATLLVCATMEASAIGDFFERFDLPYNPESRLKNVYVESAAYLLWLFLACMVCHGELYRLKPEARRLTAFYLGIAAGGALGGWIVAIICPLIFSTYYEWNIALVLVYILATTVASYVAYNAWTNRSRSVGVSSTLFSLGGLILVIVAQLDARETDHALQIRNFYGVLTVREVDSDDQPNQSGYSLVNGRILHGFQFHDPALRRLGTTYYGPESGPGRIMRLLRERQETIRYGVIGLGTGTLAVYGQPGDYLSFYEIDPHVLALQGKYFTYLEDCPADVQVVLGDARICLENQKPQQFDLLIIDAFSGDAIPAHLVTLEALEVYRRHLKPGGLIAFHVSNRYVDLLPVVKALAEHADMHLLRFVKTTTDDFADLASDYLVLTSDDTFGARAGVQAEVLDPREGKRILWTDQFSNLIEVLR